MVGDPWLGFAVGVAPVALALLLRFSWIRLVGLLGGGMFVLGSSSDVSATKMIYAGLLVFCATVSAYRLVKDPPPFAPYFRPLMWWGLGIAAMLLISYLASPAGSDFGTFARQSIFYFLVILGPIIGLDAGRDLKPATVYSLVGFVGVVAAVGFAADWLDRRGVTSLPFGRIVMSSLVLPAFAFSLALVLFFHARGFFARAINLIPILVIPVSMLVTGTRTNLIIFAAIPAVLGRLRNMRVPSLRMIALIALGGAAGVAIFPAVASLVIEQPGFIERRIEAALTVLTGSAGADQSFSGRSEQAAGAAAMIERSPVFGYGLGYQIPSTVDSFLLTVLRVGWLGTALLGAFVLAFSIAVWRSRRLVGPSPAHTAWWGFVVVLICNIPFGTPFEDRGFGFTLMVASMALGSALTASAKACELMPASDFTRRMATRSVG
jgi:hypothetical protein